MTTPATRESSSIAIQLPEMQWDSVPAAPTLPCLFGLEGPGPQWGQLRTPKFPAPFCPQFRIKPIRTSKSDELSW